MSRLIAAAVAIALLSVVAPQTGAARSKKKEEAPPSIDFTVLRDGAPAGTFSYKTAAFSGKVFTSSQLEMKTSRGTLAILTHVERDKAGKLLKYRKWVGNEGARPDVIAFWKGAKLRIVSKLKGRRFQRDIKPKEGFVVLDQLGFHLYAYMAGLWKSKRPATAEAVTVHKGRVDAVTMAPVGTARLKNPKGEEVTAEAIQLKSKSFNLVLFVGDNPTYLGFRSSHVLLVRKGWNFLGMEAGVKPEQVKPEQVKPEQVKPEQVKPEPEEGAADGAERVEKGPGEPDVAEPQNERLPELPE